MSDDNSLQGVLYPCLQQSRLFSFSLSISLRIKKIVLTEERIQISRHPLCCPTCGEMWQQANLPSSALSASTRSTSSLTPPPPPADWAFDEIIKILNFPNSPGLAREALVGVLNNEDYQMRRDHFERWISKFFVCPAPLNQATCISDAMKILNKNELKILINSHSHSHVAKHK